MAQREQWTYPFLIDAVIDAAERGANYHRERETCWQDELKTAENKLRTSGVEIREQPITGGMRPELVLDPTLAARMTECRSKVSQHQKEAEAFEAYVVGLNACKLNFRNGDSSIVMLDISDVRYFGLDREREEH